MVAHLLFVGFCLPRSVAFLLYSLSYIPWCIDFIKRMFSRLF